MITGILAGTGFVALIASVGLAATSAISFMMNFFHLGNQLVSRRRERCFCWRTCKVTTIGAVAAAGLSGLSFFLSLMNVADDALASRKRPHHERLTRMH